MASPIQSSAAMRQLLQTAHIHSQRQARHISRTRWRQTPQQSTCRHYHQEATQRPRPNALRAAIPQQYHPHKFHTSSPCPAARDSVPTTQNRGEKPPDSAPTTDFGRMDMFSELPPPSTSIDICYPRGFRLNSGLLIEDGSGVLLVGGEAFTWRPWGKDKRLVNAKGQWELPEEAFGLLGMLWPRPDLLILGLGAEMRPISPQTREHISKLGYRLEIADTGNAASQFNLLATERGVDDVAAALIPMGWEEGHGAR